MIRAPNVSIQSWVVIYPTAGLDEDYIQTQIRIVNVIAPSWNSPASPPPRLNLSTSEPPSSLDPGIAKRSSGVNGYMHIAWAFFGWSLDAGTHPPRVGALCSDAVVLDSGVITVEREREREFANLMGN